MKLLFPLYLASVDLIMISLLKAAKINWVSGFWVLPLSMLIYATQPIFFFIGLSFQSMTVLNVLWDVLSDLLVAIVGILVFKESINSTQVLGILLAISGIAMLAKK